jgi:putative ABC transport system permease protein
MNERPFTSIRVVTPGFFHTVRAPLLRGREFTKEDNGSPAPGFVVNAAFVRRYLSDVDPLNVPLKVWMLSDNPYQPIIGVVGDINEGSARKPAEPTVFYSFNQLPGNRMVIVARAGNAGRVAPLAVAAIHRLDPNLVVAKLRTFDDAYGESLAQERLSALVSGGFALSGLLLAALGLYGLLAFMVTERTKEIGLRMALGAQPSQVTWSVVRDGLQLVTVGAAIGVVLSLALLRSIGSLLFGVHTNDASTYGAVIALLWAVAAMAAFIPVRRAARVDPMIALRYE